MLSSCPLSLHQKVLLNKGPPGGICPRAAGTTEGAGLVTTPEDKTDAQRISRSLKHCAVGYRCRPSSSKAIQEAGVFRGGSLEEESSKEWEAQQKGLSEGRRQRGSGPLAGFQMGRREGSGGKCVPCWEQNIEQRSSNSRRQDSGAPLTPPLCSSIITAGREGKDTGVGYFLCGRRHDKRFISFCFINIYLFLFHYVLGYTRSQ